MTLIMKGVKARITDNTPVETDSIAVFDTPHGDKPHVRVRYIPANNDHREVDEYHDVVVRGPRTLEEEYEHRRTDGPFDQNEAAEHAVSLAERFDIPLVDPIHRLEYYEEAENDEEE